MSFWVRPLIWSSLSTPTMTFTPLYRSSRFLIRSWTSGFCRVLINFCGSIPTMNLFVQTRRFLYWIWFGISVRASLAEYKYMLFQVRGEEIRTNTYRRLAQVSMKFCLYSSVWKPIRSLDNKPSIRCFRTGRFLQKSPAGNGVCREKPIAQDLPCCLRRWRRSSGNNMR